MDEKTLRSALTVRTSRAGGTDSFVTPYRVEQAVAARDSMAKALYGALFDWIVDKVGVGNGCGLSYIIPYACMITSTGQCYSVHARQQVTSQGRRSSVVKRVCPRLNS